MAVRHGYGKIAGTDALVFAYDTGDTRNSYRGEPTTNLITDTSDFGNSFWNQKSGTFTANDVVGPRGIQNAAKIVAVNTDPYIYSSAVVTVTAGSVTWSIWVKGVGNTIGKSAEVRINFTGTASGTDNNVSVTLTDQWQLLQASATATGGGTIKFGLEAPNGAVSGDIMYFADPMFEQKTHATQFVNGTRSATQGLLDLTGNVTIDLSPSGFDSNAKPYFDGVSERIAISDPGYPSSGTDPFTLELIYRVPTGATWYNAGSGTGFIGRGSYGGSIGIFRGSTEGYVSFWVRLDGGNIYDPAVTGLSRDVYNHIVGTFDGVDTAKIYHNGQYITQEVNANNAGTLDAGGFNVGGGTSFGGVNGGYGEGEVPVVKLYNRALTAQEVLNNFNFYKGRFGM